MPSPGNRWLFHGSILLLFSCLLADVASLTFHPISSNLTCHNECGTLPLHYPFGSGFGCGHPDFSRYIRCSSGTLQFSTASGTYDISSIDYESNSLIVEDPLMSTCSSMQNSGSFSLDRSSPFTLTGDNIFVLLGCSTTSPVFDPDEGLCATGSASRLCRGLYSCKGVAGIGLSQYAPTSSCCVYESPIQLGGYMLDLPKLQCSSYTSVYSFGSNKGDPMKWKYGISLKYNSSYYTEECKDCESSGGVCGFQGLDQSFACVCPNRKNSTNNCFGRGYSWSGTEVSNIQVGFSFGGTGFGMGRLPGADAILFTVVLVVASLRGSHGVQPLSRIAIHKAVVALDQNAFVKASPNVLGLKGQNSEWVTLEYVSPSPSNDDWIGVFSPANFSASTCSPDGSQETSKALAPYLCTAPIKFQYANYSSPNYKHTGKGVLRLLLINQRSDFSFGLFSGGLSKPKLVAVSSSFAFANPNAPLYPRLAQGKEWNEMTVTWTSGYGITEAEPFVEWSRKGGDRKRSPAGTLTIDRSSMCGAPARTVGWRDPGYIHTSFLKELWPNVVYIYKLGHLLRNGSYIWSRDYQFKASPFPGQSSLQRIIIFGDMGKDEVDGSNEYNNFQRGSLNTTKQLIEDLEHIDIVFHIGDLCYATGYISQWDQFTAQIEPIASRVPYMVASGNHERDWPGTGSFYGNLDSGGECGVLAETMFYVPAENRAKFWYSTDYGMFRFCIADTEHDWREGSEQYKFIEHCLATVDRRKQPWLIFLAHRVLGYSSATWYANEGSFEEPMGRESLQKLWQKHKVDIALYGHVHNYERTCPIYQNICTSKEKYHYKGPLNGTIHVVAGGGGASLAEFTPLNTTWSYFKDYDYGFVKLTAFNHTDLLFEYKKSRDGKVYDSFTISRDYKDILACVPDSCPSTTLAF